jgi:hypothetical protein
MEFVSFWNIALPWIQCKKTMRRDSSLCRVAATSKGVEIDDVWGAIVTTAKQVESRSSSPCCYPVWQNTHQLFKFTFVHERLLLQIVTATSLRSSDQMSQIYKTPIAKKKMTQILSFIFWNTMMVLYYDERGQVKVFHFLFVTQSKNIEKCSKFINGNCVCVSVWREKMK